MSRLEILEASLLKKQAAFDDALAAHMLDVKRANGQPLNDKRCGFKTMRRWDKQNERLRTINEGIEKTKKAIERERDAIARAKSVEFPPCIQEFIDSGTLTVWRKFPNYLFVQGVEKARIKYVSGKILASHFNGLPPDQYAKFRDVFNGLRKSMQEQS